MTLIEQDTVKVDLSGAVAEVTINRPQSLNALNADVLGGLILHLDKLLLNQELRAVIITGAGEKAFVAGADIHTMAQLGPRPIADYVELGQRAMRRIESFPRPVIAAVNGYALGGGLELAIACDIIIASKAAKLGQPEVNLGIIPGFGGTQRLLQRCGIGAAKRLVLSGEIIGADEAYNLGIVDQLCEPGDLLDKARALAQTISKKAPLAVRRAKQVINRAGEQALLGGLQSEVEAFLELFGTADREEGMQAFMQKREAKFIGK